MMPRCLPSLLCCGLLLLAACAEEGKAPSSLPKEDVVEEPILPITVSTQPSTLMTELGQRPTLMLELEYRSRYDTAQLQSIVDAIVLIRLSDGAKVPVAATWTNPVAEAELQEWLDPGLEPAILALNPLEALEESWHLLTFSKAVEGVVLADSSIPGVVGTVFHPAALMLLRDVSITNVGTRPPWIDLTFTQPLEDTADVEVFGDGERCLPLRRTAATRREFECPVPMLEQSLTIVGLNKLSSASGLPLLSLNGKPMAESFELSLTELDGYYPTLLHWMPPPTPEMTAWLSQP